MYNKGKQANEEKEEEEEEESNPIYEQQLATIDFHLLISVFFANKLHARARITANAKQVPVRVDATVHHSIVYCH